LQGIDAPEKRQAWGHRTLQNLASLAFHKEVTAECGKVDRYGRKSARFLSATGTSILRKSRAGWLGSTGRTRQNRSRPTEKTMKRRRRPQGEHRKVCGPIPSGSRRWSADGHNVLDVPRVCRRLPPVILACLLISDSTCRSRSHPLRQNQTAYEPLRD
jgi:hypothetical protein